MTCNSPARPAINFSELIVINLLRLIPAALISTRAGEFRFAYLFFR